METAEFALYKFKTIEGVDIHWKSGDFTHSKYCHNGKSAEIEYFPATDRAMVTFKGELKPAVKFDKLREYLETLGIFKESPKEERHSSSYAPL